MKLHDRENKPKGWRFIYEVKTMETVRIIYLFIYTTLSENV